MRNDPTRTAAAKARTMSRRTARKVKIAQGMAMLIGLVAWGDETTVSTFAR